MDKVIALIFITTIWQLLFNFFGNSNSFLPSPLEIFNTFTNTLQSGEIIDHVLNSLLRVSVGFFIASIIGISLAIFLSLNKKINNILRPLIDIIQPIPPIAWIPIAILLFGLGNNSAYFIVFIGGFFPIFNNTYFGASSIPNIYINISKTYQFSKLVYITKILLPYSLPYIFTGLKIGLGMSWMSVIAAELIGSQNGLGYFIQMNRMLLRTDNVLLGMILIGIFGMLLNLAINYVASSMMPWREKKND